MTGRDMTLSDAERLVQHVAEARRGDAGAATAMDEDAFRAFYDRTARILWAYLSRVTGDPQAADDLLQEAYYRFVRSTARLDGETHARHYLFRIATNLAHDHHRRPRVREEPLDEEQAAVTAGDPELAERAARRQQLRAAMEGLKRRERELLWLAYAEGWSHREIAGALGVKASGVRVLLYRARRRLARLLGRGESEGGHHGR